MALDDLNGPLAARLRLDEGVRLMPYLDTVGKTTIGVGRNLTDRGLTPAEVDVLFATDLRLTVRDCRALFPWFDGLSEARQVVVASMLFNLGAAGLQKFVGTLAAISSGDYVAASARMLQSKWAKQVGARADRLAQMMRDGV